MKTLHITENGALAVNFDTKEVTPVSSEYTSIHRIYVAKEPMHIVYTSGEYTKEANADENDIIVTFYNKDYKERLVVIKSAQWADNIKNYNEILQKQKEDWAKEKQCCDKCESK